MQLQKQPFLDPLNKHEAPTKVCKEYPWSKWVRKTTLSWPGHYRAPWMAVFSPFVGRALTVTHPAMTVTPALRASHQQGPATSNEPVKGPCLWTVATNTSWFSPTAQRQTPTAVRSATATTEKRCTARTSFPPLFLHPSLSICLSPSSRTCAGLQPVET